MSSTEDRLRDNTDHLEQRLGAALTANHQQPTTSLGTLEPMPLAERPWRDGTTVAEVPTEPAVWVRTEGTWYRAENLDAVPALGATATAVDEWINEQIAAGKLRDPRPPQYRLTPPDLVVDDPTTPNRADERMVSFEQSRQFEDSPRTAYERAVLMHLGSATMTGDETPDWLSAITAAMIAARPLFDAAAGEKADR